MLRRGILTMARVSPPPRRSAPLIALSDILAGGFARREILRLAATAAAPAIHQEIHGD